MALTAAKILYGPFDFDLISMPSTSKFARSGLIEDALASFNGETFEMDRKVADGSKVYWEEGRELVIELVFSELDPTASTGDLAKIEEADKITLTFSNPSKTITVENLESVRAHIDGLKTKIICKKSKPTAQEWSDIFSVG